MSKFFRSEDSSSSSNSDSAEDGEVEVKQVNEDLSSSSASSDLAARNTARRAHFQTAISHEAATQNDLAVNPRHISESRQAVEPSPAKWNPTHRDILLHALLEERCINEALASHNNTGLNRPPRRDSPEVQTRAKAGYQNICTQLASLNLISSGLETDQHARTRQRYRDGLDILSQQQSTTAVPPRLRRLLTDTDTEIAPHGSSQNLGHLALRDGLYEGQALPYPLRRLLTGAETVNQQRHDNHMQLHDSHMMQLGAAAGDDLRLRRYGLPEPRYFQEFEELSMLGRGGYGIVYHVRHRLDNQFYAVKKVPLSASRLKRIQQKGQSELDEVLRELRILARLDHPNIVRYYTGWIEWVDRTPPAGFEAVLGADEDSELGSSRRVVTSDLEETNIVFEKSDLDGGHTADAASARLDYPHNRDSDAAATSPTKQRLRAQFSGDVANETNGTIESIGRMVGTSSNIQSGFDSAHFKEPTFALHIQMSLHPMTLADYLSPAINTGDTPPLSHCYHLEPSVSILLAMLDGIEYLHNEGIVHRDIKPGNIFLGRKDNPRSTRGSVDLMLCSDCRAQRKAAPIRLEIRIGDFGLVTFADPEAQKTEDQRAVGTEIYRPALAHPPKGFQDEIDPRAYTAASSRSIERGLATQPSHNHPKVSSASLDIYALGIIAFEMLWKFNTRMERLQTIQRLKQGEFPHGFSDRLGKHGRKVTECISAMLSQNGDSVSIAEIKQVLSMIQSPRN